jgi:hypothetical protein
MDWAICIAEVQLEGKCAKLLAAAVFACRLLVASVAREYSRMGATGLVVVRPEAVNLL